MNKERGRFLSRKMSEALSSSTPQKISMREDPPTFCDLLGEHPSAIHRWDPSLGTIAEAKTPSWKHATELFSPGARVNREPPGSVVSFTGDDRDVGTLGILTAAPNENCMRTPSGVPARQPACCPATIACSRRRQAPLHRIRRRHGPCMENRANATAGCPETWWRFPLNRVQPLNAKTQTPRRMSCPLGGWWSPFKILLPRLTCPRNLLRAALRQCVRLRVPGSSNWYGNHEKRTADNPIMKTEMGSRREYFSSGGIEVFRANP